MQKVTALFSILLLACTSVVRADDDTFIDYHNYKELAAIVDFVKGV